MLKRYLNIRMFCMNIVQNIPRLFIREDDFCFEKTQKNKSFYLKRLKELINSFRRFK